ncbi:MAG: DUF2085 domain-containing protein [Chloroflexi bacterium]|nr:DUF2085 domain-containing protein [Chloroflexota bacterium]OJV86793.1 MAG: hypothetical protein BGO39_13220 [Chloroflexi bacterium 54-19]
MLQELPKTENVAPDLTVAELAGGRSSKPDPLRLAYEVEGISPWRQNFSRRFMQTFFGFGHFVADHWLVAATTLNGLCLGAAFAAPLFSLAGWNGPANLLYNLFHYVCVQNPQHSFYLGGHQMCICERCMAIYGGLFLAGLVFYLVRDKIKPLKTWHFILFFCPPIALDAFTQLFGWRESTWELRLLTGGWFALGACWALYPMVEAKMRGLKSWASRELSLLA